VEGVGGLAGGVMSGHERGARDVLLQTADAEYLLEPEAKAFQPLLPPTRRLSAAHASDAEPQSWRSCRRKPSIASRSATARSTSGLVPATYAPISMRSLASRYAARSRRISVASARCSGPV